jgi:two-component system response regulator FlrC
LSPKIGRPLFLSEGLLGYLVRQRWDGNIRELENFIYRTAVMSADNSLAAPPDALPGAGAPSEGSRTGKIKDVERDLIISTLREVQGNRTRAAERLGVTVRTIRNKLKDYNITEEEIGS